MNYLNEEQIRAINCNDNIIITACPGSGKTRVLIAKVINCLQNSKSSKEHIVSLTFTNRATDEIIDRITKENIDYKKLWSGTIHSFALEWILRPYAGYIKSLKFGFTVADEFYCEKLLSEIKNENGLQPFDEISTSISRDGKNLNNNPIKRKVCFEYKKTLHKNKYIDYDDVLFLAYKLLKDNPEICRTLSNLISVICVDEVQDIQDLQFGILSRIYTSTNSPPQLFFVGDENQSIYESLGAQSKTPSEIVEEFSLDNITHLELIGNYRSSQKIIDYYRLFREMVPIIESRVNPPISDGKIVYYNQTIHKEDLPELISTIITKSLDSGIPQEEICVLAPQWWLVRSITRKLIKLLPEINFDAPGLSPLYSTRDNFWYKLCRLFLTTPSTNTYYKRHHWAKDLLTNLETLSNTTLPEIINSPKRLLRVVNSISSDKCDGLLYIHDIFSSFLNITKIELDSYDSLFTAYTIFFNKIEERISEQDNNFPNDILHIKKLFNQSNGITVNTCHGVKGEEYDTVIAFGLLKGYIPHWSLIIEGDQTKIYNNESKLLYVICSRARRNLFLISESGRETKKSDPYETCNTLNKVKYSYDVDI